MSKHSRSSYGYGSYRGPRSGGASSVLKGIILVLVISILTLAGLLFFLQDYLVYADDGVHLTPPWLSQQANQPPASPSPEISSPILITDDPVPVETAPVEEIPPNPLHAVLISQTALLADTAADQTVATGGNAVIVSMKNDDGTLNYVSAVPLAVSAGASGSDPNANAAIKALAAREIYTIAQVSCFRDHLLPGYDRNLAIHTNSGYRWTDHEDLRWTSPANETVVNYLTDLCVELAKLGFDEILLTNCGYPPAQSGNLGWIRKGDPYPKGALDTVLTRFIEQVRQALEPLDVKLSVYTDAKYLEGTMGPDTDTGLTPSLLLDNCDHIWLPAVQVEAGLNYSSQEDQAAAEGRIIRMGTTAGPEDISWAIWG